MKTSLPPLPFLNRLQSMTRWKRLSKSARVPAFGLAGLILLMLMAAAADWLFVLDPAWRAAGFVFLSGLLILLLWHWLSVMNQPVGEKDVALDAEEGNRTFSTVVSTAVEYHQNPERTAGDIHVQNWVSIMQGRAAAIMIRYRPPYMKQLGLAGITLFGALTLLMIYLLVLPEGWTSLMRLLPWTPASYTRIELINESVKIPLGASYEIQAAITGRATKSVILHYKPQGQTRFQKIQMDEVEPGLFTYEIPLVEKSFTYFLTAADGKTPAENVTAFESPRIDEFIIRVTPPDYTGQPAYTLGAPDAHVLRGSRVEYGIKTFPRLKKAGQLRGLVEYSTTGKVISKGRFDENFTPSGDDRWTVEWLSNVPAEYLYAITLTDQLDQSVTNQPPYRFSFIADETPNVRITFPAKDIVASAKANVVVKAEAKDEFKIEKMRIIYNKLGEPARTNQLENLSRDGQQWAVSAEIDLGDLDLKDYELVAYFVEAEDNNTLDGPGIGKSQTYFIEITNEKAALSQCQGGGGSSGDKVNLLVSQKNIISTSNQLIERGEENRSKNLAVSQKVVREYALVYRDAMQKAGLPDPALEKMDEAIHHMGQAEERLLAGNIREALSAEQKALAALYQVVQLTPGKRPLVIGHAEGDQAVAILLEAIHQFAEADDKEIQAQLREIIDEARELARMAETIMAERHKASGKGKNKGKGKGQEKSMSQEEEELKGRGKLLAEKIKELAEKDDRVKKELAEELLKEMNAIGEYVSPSGEVHEVADFSGTAFALANENLRPVLLKIISDLGRIEKNFEIKKVFNDEYPQEYQPYVEDYFRKLTREE